MMKIVIPGRRKMLALATVVLLAACGTPTDEQGSGAGSKPAVIELPASGGPNRGAEAAASADAPAGESMSIDQIRMAWMTFRYEGELPALDGDAPSWFFPTGATPDEAKVRQLAAALGVDGEFRALSADEGGGWAIGSTDGSGPGLMVSAASMLDWWYNSGPGEAFAVPACEILEDGSTTCPEPTPPANVPTGSEAEAKARGIWEAGGFDLDDFVIEANGDEWGSYVSGSLKLDGKKSPVQMSIGFGAEGAVTYASGFMVMPQRGADYPRIGAAEGLDRLIAQNGGGFTTDVARGDVSEPLPADGDVAVASPVVEPEELPVSPVEPLPSVVPGEPPASAMPIEPGVGYNPICPPIDPAATSAVGDDVLIDPAVGTPAVDAPEPAVGIVAPDFVGCFPEEPPTPIEIVLTGVTEDLTMVWAADNTVWLLPAYTFTSSDGGLYTVTAVADEFLSYGDAEVPAEPVAPPVAPPVDPGIPTDDGQTAPAPPGGACAEVAAYEPIVSDTVQPFDGGTWEQLIGMCLADAQREAARNGTVVREVRVDGVDMPVTADFSESRINVATQDGVVTEILSIG